MCRLSVHYDICSLMNQLEKEKVRKRGNTRHVRLLENKFGGIEEGG